MSITVYALTPDNPRQLETFRRYLPQGVELIWVDSTQPVEQQATQLKDAVAVIAAPSAFSVDLALACPNLKLIQTVSAGTNMIDLPALDELGIKVANNGGGNAVAVAEHSIALMVSVYRNLKRQFQSVQGRRHPHHLASQCL
jgi:lactate dehydrogenase-like 2-hydroxyacid dehydrogenase